MATEKKDDMNAGTSKTGSSTEKSSITRVKSDGGASGKKSQKDSNEDNQNTKNR